MAVPIPAMMRPMTIMPNFVAPACKATPTRRITVPREKAWQRPRNWMNHHATKRFPRTFPRLTRFVRGRVIIRRMGLWTNPC